MTKDDASRAYSLVSLYSSLYKDKYNKAIVINKHKEKWGMAEVIDSVGFDRAKELLIYYFNTSRSSHPLQWFFYNFERLDAVLTAKALDAERRKTLLEQTKKMVLENEQ
ncbi:MAG: hypothetical protein EB127_00885 [Alphaproteobacteria bacterium]|nr:hypothetical protein [Alphaproteobacteria bacterium]